MGTFCALNGWKVYPSFCSNSRYCCTVYKDKIPHPVFNIDNPWINIFLPVCQSQKCQRWSGRHPRAGSLSLIRCCAPPALHMEWNGGKASQLPHCWQPKDVSDVCREMCPQVITTSQPHTCLLQLHLTRWAGCSPSPGPIIIWMIKVLRKGVGANLWGCKGLQPCSDQHVAPHPLLSCGLTPGDSLLSIAIIGLYIALPKAECWHTPALTPLWNWDMERSAQCFKTSQGSESTCCYSLVRLKCLLWTFGNLAH